MNLFVRTQNQKEYHKQSYGYPFMTSDVKPGDTLYSLWADYHVDKVKYSKTELIVYATKTQIFTNDEITPCKLYICQNKNAKDMKSDHNDYKYVPRCKEKRINRKKEKLEKIRLREW